MAASYAASYVQPIPSSGNEHEICKLMQRHDTSVRLYS
jgi:hypothetical protein